MKSDNKTHTQIQKHTYTQGLPRKKSYKKRTGRMKKIKRFEKKPVLLYFNELR